MRDPVYPIYLRNKGDTELKKFASTNEVRRYVEDIDVENGEYEGWDNSGQPVALALDQTRALSVKTHAGPSAREQALQAFAAFAAAEGIEFTPTQNERDFEKIFGALAEAMNIARRRKQWWNRTSRRI